MLMYAGGVMKKPYDKGSSPGKPPHGRSTARPPRKDFNRSGPRTNTFGDRAGTSSAPRASYHSKEARPWTDKGMGKRPTSAHRVGTVPPWKRDTRPGGPSRAGRPWSGQGAKPFTPRPYPPSLPRPHSPSPRLFPKPGSPSRPPSAPIPHQTDWGHVARWYDEHLSSKDTYHASVVLPNLLRLVAPKKGDTILDVPCGNGYFARAFAKEGAEVIAIDLGKELVAHASRESTPGVRYFVASSDKLPMAHDASVDKAAVVLGIQNIKNVDGTFTEIARALKEDGELHIVMNHPVFRIPRASSWGWDKTTTTQYRRLDAYLSESQETIDMHPGKTAEGIAPQNTVSFHRPLQWYFKLLGKHGFAVDRLEEWISSRMSDSGPRAEAENKARREFPLFLYMRGRKLPLK